MSLEPNTYELIRAGVRNPLLRLPSEVIGLINNIVATFNSRIARRVYYERRLTDTLVRLYEFFIPGDYTSPVVARRYRTDWAEAQRILARNAANRAWRLFGPGF